MCGHCGCGDEAATTVLNLRDGEGNDDGRGAARARSRATASPRHDHDHAHDHRHDHDHRITTTATTRPSHDSHGRRPAGELVELETRILAKNDAMAEKNRAWFKGREILALNLVSSPGAGKTTLLERTIRDLRDELPLYVIEGDQATANDGERIRAAGAPAVQVNTGSGCHLEADMVARGLAGAASPPAGSVVMIENVGNLVCPALFDLGERAKVVILSVTEGDDKPLKYPHMFQAARDDDPQQDGPFAARRFRPRARHRQRASSQSVDLGDPAFRPHRRGTRGWYDWLRNELARVQRSGVQLKRWAPARPRRICRFRENGHSAARRLARSASRKSRSRSMRRRPSSFSSPP